MADSDVIAAIRKAVAEHPDGVEAGPAALLKAVQEASALPEVSGIGFQKFKRVLAKVKPVLIKEKEAEELARTEASKPQKGTAENCPGRCGLTRFMTNHTSYCCDVCRCYLPEGAPMWGCRDCDWDVCEGRCHPACMTLPDLRSRMTSLANKVDALLNRLPLDMKTQLALLEVEVQKLEKQMDSAVIQDLVKYSLVKLTEDEARAERKVLLAKADTLLTKIELTFKDLRGVGKDNANAEEAAAGQE